MNTLAEIISTIAIVAIVILFLNPTGLTMPESTLSMLILGLIVAFLAFAALIWKEKSADEREQLHVFQSGRISFLIGTSILVIAIVSQVFTHEVDPWLVIALSVMVLSKLLMRVYSRFKM